MEDSVTKKHKYLGKRGSTYSIRVPVPIQLQKALKRKEVTRSLKTKDPAQADKLYPERLGEVLKIFEVAEAKLDQTKPAMLIGFQPFGTVNSWFHQCHEKITNSTKAQFKDKAHLEDYKLDIKSDLAELTSNTTERRFHAVQFTANKLLLEQGYEVREGTHIANVDFTDPKYDQFLELLISAQVELSEYELGRLGVKVARTPNGNVFWQKTSGTDSIQKTGTPLSKLISEYMAVKGSHGKNKTIEDKYAAFRYLTELVGEGFLVESLTRDHFMQIRDLLSAFPKSARNYKALKGKSLQDISAYAKQHKLDLMSKQNANKIIARLKSLMEYTVSIALITHNPCKEIEFYISPAEKEESARKPFSEEQLQKLFTSKAFDKTYPMGPGKFWVPLIALMHGFRMEEILIITLKEIKHDEKMDIWYFDLTDFTTDELKNNSAIRRVPFCPMMETLGFHKYLTSCKKNKGILLFPELTRATGVDMTYRKKFSRWFSRYSRKIGVHTKQTVFHSFRHNFAIACTDALIPIDYENALAGWRLVGGQGGTYKKPKDLSLEKLSEMMSRIEYPKLDLSHLYDK